MYYSIRQIEVFFKTSQTLSITQTAKALNMTVPAAWKHIHNLEQLCQKQLFSRHGKKFLLTPEGAELARGAEVFLQAKDQFSASINELNQEEQATIRLSITNTFQSTIFMLLSPFLEQYPHVQLDLTVDKWGDQQVELENNRHDFYIISDPLTYSQDWETYSLFEFEFVLTVSSAHPLASKKKIDLADLATVQFLTTRLQSPTKIRQKKLMTQWGATKSPLYLDSYMAIREAAKANIGVAILPITTLAEDIKTKKLKVLPYKIDDFSAKLVLINRKNKYQSRAHKLFKDFLIQRTKTT
ncbi:LysR family transcriptional regulator [Piscirickettsia litoralis]|uniref:HTH lysR-type domain-containing protein n=1 Tax=Piscirickettsia litoralis TaxID=1891921 RepID=A0ABX3A066_9GAMM|nr:LysR family transcriptional regulator [Piscirickettsia litoralis]ODN42256.1 hypothetical protein BGC07_04030 [Piscirickettsia litoralis]